MALNFSQGNLFGDRVEGVGIGRRRADLKRIWNCIGTNFTARAAATNTVTYSAINGSIEAGQNDLQVIAPVFLPNGSFIKSVIVRGSNSAKEWALIKAAVDISSSVTVATANINTEDTTITRTNATVDNENFVYLFRSQNFDDTELIYSATIIYEIAEDQELS